MGKLTHWISILVLIFTMAAGSMAPGQVSAQPSATQKQTSTKKKAAPKKVTAAQKKKATEAKPKAQQRKKAQVRKTVVRKSSAVNKPKAQTRKPRSVRKPVVKPMPRKTAASASSPLVAYANQDFGLRAGHVNLESEAVLVLDEKTGLPLLAKNETKPRPIASVTKLMTAMVVLDAKLPLNEKITITNADVDRLKYSSSRVNVGTKLSRTGMLQLALMSSENRAAHALGRTYPGGLPAFIKAMNRKAKQLGMHSAKFVDPTGLSPRNVASPKDLAVMVAAASRYPLINKYSTDDGTSFRIQRNNKAFGNTNPLVHSDSWNIKVSKTGYIREAGRCLVMHVVINQRPTMIVLLNGARKSSRVLDSVAIKRWLEKPDTRTAIRAADLMFSHDSRTDLVAKKKV